MTATGTDDGTAHSPLAGTPNPNNNNEVDKPVPMETDEPTSEGNANNHEQTGLSASSAAGVAKSPNSSVLNTPKSASLKTPVDVFKTPEQPSTPTSSSKKRKRLTPDEKSQREKERLEKRQKFEEEKQKREDEKQKKEQEKQEKAKQREEERLKKEEEKRKLEEDKKREREKKEEERLKKEEEKRRLEDEKKREKEKKDEEKRRAEEEKKQERQKREEERLKKEEERKKKEDERRKAVEEKEKERQRAEDKKAKQAHLFTSFFQKSSARAVKTATEDIVYPTTNGNTATTLMTTTNDEKEKTKINTDGAEASESVEGSKSISLFNPLPFQIKTDMAVAPVCRRQKLSTEEVSNLDSLFAEEGSNASPVPTSDFLTRIKTRQGRSHGKTTIKKDEADVQILDDDTEKPGTLSGYIKYRMKLLQFHENRRPAYWGTWKRRGKKVNARKPLANEEDIDYEFDSDDEWEDEPEDAEEIEDSDKDETEEKEDGEDDEDEEGWMVPHGYLSDTEREGNRGDIESLKSKEKEFYKSLKEKTMIGLPFVECHDDLSIYAMIICPVFKSADPVKPVRKRAKPVEKKPVENTVNGNPTPTIPPPSDLKKETPQGEKSRKSNRIPKVPDTSNPYARPPSGFLALELPSDDDDDMNWGEEDEESDSSSSSDDEEGDDELDEDEVNECRKLAPPIIPETDSSLDDLFIPIREKKKKSSSPKEPANSN